MKNQESQLTYDQRVAIDLIRQSGRLATINPVTVRYAVYVNTITLGQIKEAGALIESMVTMILGGA